MRYGSKTCNSNADLDPFSSRKVKETLLDNSVLILFIIICGIGLVYANQPGSYIVDQVVTRFFRNLVLVLSLLIPVWAGMGLNFSIVVGAMSAQAGLIMTLNYNITGINGIASSFLFGAPIAVFLGILTGRLFNRTKGQEMITGMILGYFANGIYQLIFMYLCGPVIPIHNKSIMLNNGIGINGIVTFDQSLNGALDKLWKIPLDHALWLVIGIITVIYIINTLLSVKRNSMRLNAHPFIVPVILIMCSVALYLCSKHYKAFITTCLFTKVPVATATISVMVCMLITFLGETKLGSDIKTVGQSIPIASSSGIKVNKTRIVAIAISTLLAALGQVIYLQNMGTLTTYSAADQIGTFSVAALLVGGASIKRANIGQAILGTILFHTMFVVAPIAGKNIFGDAQIGEYFRVFVSYAVIALALALHAWKTLLVEKRNKKH